MRNSLASLPPVIQRYYLLYVTGPIVRPVGVGDVYIVHTPSLEIPWPEGLTFEEALRGWARDEAFRGWKV